MSINHLGTQLILTDRLILRRYEETDIVPIYKNLFSDENTAYYMSRTSWENKGIKDIEDRIKHRIASYNDKTFYRWIITLKDGTQIGEIGVTFFNEEKQVARIGYSLGSKWWNKGYMTEAAKHIVGFLIHRVRFNYIEALYREDNIRSKRVFEKLGMKYIDTEYREIKKTNGTKKTIVYHRYRVKSKTKKKY